MTTLICAVRVIKASHVISALHAQGSHKLKLAIPMASGFLKIAGHLVYYA